VGGSSLIEEGFGEEELCVGARGVGGGLVLLADGEGFAGEGFGAGGLVASEVEEGEGFEGGGDAGLVVADAFLEEGDGLGEEWLGFVVALEVGERGGELLERDGEAEGVFAGSGAEGGDGGAEERFGVVEVCAVSEERAEGVLGHGEFGEHGLVFGGERLADVDCFAVQCFGGLFVGEFLFGGGEVLEGEGEISLVGIGASEVDGELVVFGGGAVVGGEVEGAGEVVVGLGDERVVVRECVFSEFEGALEEIACAGGLSVVEVCDAEACAVIGFALGRELLGVDACEHGVDVFDGHACGGGGFGIEVCERLNEHVVEGALFALCVVGEESLCDCDGADGGEGEECDADDGGESLVSLRPADGAAEGTDAAGVDGVVVEDAPEFVGEFGGGGVSAVGVFVEGFEEDCVEVAREGVAE